MSEMTEEELLSLLALAYVYGLSPSDKRHLLSLADSAQTIIKSHSNIRTLMPNADEHITEALRNIDDCRRKAETEMEFAEREHLDIIPITAERYPQRLKLCDDAPVILFLKGEGNLNPRHSISIVGTRHCTTYGQDMVRHFVSEIAATCPDTLIVSGLAYGIDINAHRNALTEGLPTVAVMAHGLDRLYPPAHKETAKRMEEKGGLITENFTGTVPDRLHFLSRNRIVAGLSDAVVVVESAHHGGALVTARNAMNYGRMVAAYPGRVGDEYSEGCNNLIKDGKARLITSAADLMLALGWQNEKQANDARKRGVERTLFPDLTAEEQTIVDLLVKQGDLHLNTICATLQKPAGKLAATLFSLEMKGVVKPLAGSMYHILK